MVDLDRDGRNEVILQIINPAGDMGGYLALHAEDNTVYGHRFDYRSFWDLKTDGTFSYSDASGREEGTASVFFERQKFAVEKHIVAQGEPFEFHTFLIDGKSVSEEECRAASEEQDKKPDAIWYAFDQFGEAKGEPEQSSTPADKGNALWQAVLSHNRRAEGMTGIYSCASFITLGEEFHKASHDGDVDTVTCYGWALYGEYMPSGIRLAEISGSHVPVVIRFDIGENGEYSLAEYWEPRDGSYFVSDIREKVPANLYEDMIDSQKFFLRQKQECYAQAAEVCGLEPDMAVEGLLGMVTESPKGSSNPQDYIEEHLSEYREMTYYGASALKYCFSRFEKGGETGLEGQIMARVCSDIAHSFGEAAAWERGKSGTGQEWYNAVKAYARGLKEQYAPTEIAEQYPASYLLLEALGK